MQIAILGGTGRMGIGLATAWTKAGHEVIIASRDESRARHVAEEAGKNCTGTNYQSAASRGEVVVIAVPYRSVAACITPLRATLVNKIVVDITNPFNAVDPGQTSGLEETQKLLPLSQLVSAFKTNFWRTLQEPVAPNGIRRDCLICGDDEDAKKAVGKLAEDIGYRSVDCGGARAARALDVMVPLLIEMDRRHGGDALTSWKFLSPDGT